MLGTSGFGEQQFDIWTGREAAENISTEQRGTGVDIERAHRAEQEATRRQLVDVNKIHPGTPILATQAYNKNLESWRGARFETRDTLDHTMELEENGHWWLADNSNVNVRYVPVANLMVIID